MNERNDRPWEPQTHTHPHLRTCLHLERALLSIVVVVCYSMAEYTFLTDNELSSFPWYSYKNLHHQNITKARGICIMILVLSVLEFLLSTVSIGHYFYAKKKDRGGPDTFPP